MVGGSAPVTFGFELGDASAAQKFGEDQSAREFEISFSTRGQSGPVTYSLSGPDAGQFNINDDGTVRFADPDNVNLDQDIPSKKSTYNFTVNASDGVDEITERVTLTVQAVDEHDPVASSPSSTEGATEGTAFTFDASTIFSDDDGDNLTYTLNAAAPAWLNINPASGMITGTPPNEMADYDETITITASDGSDPTASHDLTIEVVADDDPASLAFGSTTPSVREEVAGAIITTITVDDPDTVYDDPDNNFTLLGTDAAKFEIVAVDAAAGRFNLKLKDDVSLDFDTATGGSATANVTVTLKDAASATNPSQAITITVEAYDDSPVVGRHFWDYAIHGSFWAFGLTDHSVVTTAVIDPEGVATDFYWKVVDLPKDGSFKYLAGGDDVAINATLRVDTNLIYTHDGTNRVAGADDVDVLVFEVADKDFATNPNAPTTTQYFVFIIEEASHRVSPSDADTGIRFIVPHLGIDRDDLGLRTDGGNVSNAALFEIREITAAERQAQNVPDGLPIYGVFVKPGADLTSVVDDETFTCRQVDIEVFYDIDGDPNTTDDIHTIDLTIIDVV